MSSQVKKGIFSENSKPSFLQKTDSFFVKKEKLILLCIAFLSILFSVLLFDLKVSIAGDDSGYILAAKMFLDGKEFPTWHGSFYPMFLSFFMRFLGVNILFFKLISLLLITAHLIVFYYALKKIVSPTVLFLTLFVFSVNSLLLYHASQTFSEPIFLFIQSCALWLFFSLENKADKEDWIRWLLFGLSMFLLVITRNIGIAILVSSVFYFILNKKFKQVLYSIFSFLIFYVPFLIYKQFCWNQHSAGFEGQLLKGLYKDPYNSSLGFETFGGLVERFFVNSDLYLSKNLFIILGFKNEYSTSHSIVTILLYSFFIALSVFFYRKHKKVLYLLLYVGISLAATFITQQVCWDQLRLVLVFCPLIIVIVGFSLNELLKNENLQKYQCTLVLFFVLLVVFSLFNTIAKSIENKETLSQNLKGDDLYGYTPDWVHYIDMCKWTADSIGNEKMIGLRKPEIAYIYTNRNYVGIIQPFEVPVDTVVQLCLRNDNKQYTIIQMSDLQTDNALDSLFRWRLQLDAIIFHKDGNFQFIYGYVNNQKIAFLNMLRNTNIRYSQNWHIIQNKNKEDYGFFPDSALNFIKRNNLNYIVDANLRSIPNEKTNSIIGNIRKMRLLIEYKYPGLFVKVHQCGADDDEPAELYKLHY